MMIQEKRMASSLQFNLNRMKSRCSTTRRINETTILYKRRDQTKWMARKILLTLFSSYSIMETSQSRDYGSTPKSILVNGKEMIDFILEKENVV